MVVEAARRGHHHLVALAQRLDLQAHADAARRDALHRALRELTGLNREIILLKEIQGLGVEAIAAILGVPEGTVKSRSSRARLELAEKLCAAGMGG